jgi:hypothetical protein
MALPSRQESKRARRPKISQRSSFDLYKNLEAHIGTHCLEFRDIDVAVQGQTNEPLQGLRLKGKTMYHEPPLLKSLRDKPWGISPLSKPSCNPEQIQTKRGSLHHVQTFRTLIFTIRLRQSLVTVDYALLFHQVSWL